jgi:predicted transcriptional regulator
MSGERRFKLVGLFALILICAIFLIASVASAEEGEDGDDSTIILDYANNFQESNGSWNFDINITAKLTAANYEAVTRFEIEVDDLDEYIIAADSGANWAKNNYHKDVSVETQSIIYFTSDLTYGRPAIDEWDDFQLKVGDDMITAQQSDGSWNNDVGDTAIATYALNTRGVEDYGVIGNSVSWLQEQEDELTWGSVEDDSKAILALDSAGIEIWDEISGLMLKQRPDGSFGGIEDTAWATMALSTHSNKEAADKAVKWLRSQEYKNNNDLAMAALAEQYYENAKMQEKGEGSEFIPPPWLYALSIFAISSFAFSYWLFARLDRNEILDGVRKDIYTYIAENPGEHLANITKTLDLGSSSARYHLSVLEGMDRIVSHKNGKYKRYYINKNGYSKYTNGNGYKHIMSALKNNTARKIVKFLISNPEANQKRVSNALKIHPSTVNWHAKRLRDAEIISKHKKGKEIVYSLNQNVQLRKVIGIIEGSVA